MAIKGHTFKLDEAVWDRFLVKAADRGRTGSEIIIAGIMLYLEDENPENADELDKAADAYETRGRNGRPPKDQGARIED